MDYSKNGSYRYKTCLCPFCIIISYVNLWWGHDNLEWQFIMTFLSFKLFLWNLFWGKFKKRLRDHPKLLYKIIVQNRHEHVYYNALCAVFVRNIVILQVIILIFYLSFSYGTWTLVDIRVKMEGYKEKTNFNFYPEVALNVLRSWPTVQWRRRQRYGGTRIAAVRLQEPGCTTV